MTVFEAYCLNCTTVIARSSPVVPVKDLEKWLHETRKKSGGCRKCGLKADNPRWVLKWRLVEA